MNHSQLLRRLARRPIAWAAGAMLLAAVLVACNVWSAAAAANAQPTSPAQPDGANLVTQTPEQAK